MRTQEEIEAERAAKREALIAERIRLVDEIAHVDAALAAIAEESK